MLYTEYETKKTKMILMLEILREMLRCYHIKLKYWDIQMNMRIYWYFIYMYMYILINDFTCTCILFHLVNVGKSETPKIDSESKDVEWIYCQRGSKSNTKIVGKKIRR
jgi:hypothetical protein